MANYVIKEKQVLLIKSYLINHNINRPLTTLQPLFWHGFGRYRQTFAVSIINLNFTRNLLMCFINRIVGMSLPVTQSSAHLRLHLLLGKVSILVIDPFKY